jgi:hypothetical protein
MCFQLGDGQQMTVGKGKPAKALEPPEHDLGVDEEPGHGLGWGHLESWILASCTLTWREGGGGTEDSMATGKGPGRHGRTNQG